MNRSGTLGAMSAPLGGRRAEAARNDVRVLRAAREVLTRDPEAPMADVARRAGVGVGTLYRRYASREALVLNLCLDGVRQLESEARRALESVDGDAWGAFTAFMNGAYDAGAGALGRSVASNVAQGLQLSGDLTGLDIPALLRRLSGAAGVPTADGVTRVPLVSADGDGHQH